MNNRSSNQHKKLLGRIILHSLTEHKLRSVTVLLFIVLSIVLEVIPPLILAQAVDALTGNKMISLSLAVVYFLLIACSGLADAGKEALIVAAGEGITHAIRSAMEQKLRRLPASYFTRHEAGKTASLQVNDVDAIEEMFSSGIVSMFTDLGTVCAILVVIFTKSIGLGILLLLVLPFLILFTRHTQKEMLKAHTQNRKATAQASGILPETLHTIRSLHVFHAERFYEKRYDCAIRDSFQAMERTNFFDAVYSPVIMTVSAAVIGIMMSLSGQSGTFRSWFGMSVGTAVAVIAYVSKVFTPLSSIGMEIQTVQSAAAGWKRVQKFLDEEEDTDEEIVTLNSEDERFAGNSEEDNCTLDSVEKIPSLNFRTDAIEIQNVAFSYNKVTPILEHFSLNVRKGEFVTLMGRTGAGKSTLFKLLLGLYKPDAGIIRLNGRRPQEYTNSLKREFICCVEQQISSVPGTVRDQITLGNPDFSDSVIWDALDTVGLKETVAALPEQLETPYRDSVFSQGQKQLLMIARAIVSDPEILLLDEITAGLDSATEKMIVTALQKAAAGRTVLSISHRLSETVSGRIVNL